MCSPRRDSGAARCFFTRALATTRVIPVEVTTDRAAAYPRELDELAPDAWHCRQAYANNRMAADHGRGAVNFVICVAGMIDGALLG